jgi:hypothetical protein
MMIVSVQPDGGDAPSTEPSETVEEPVQTKPTNAAAPAAAQAAAPAASGNAIYKIDPDGFVTEIFRRPVMIFSMLERNGSLIVSTGSDGEVWEVKPTAEETSVIAKVDPKQIMCLLPARDGKIYLGMANSGEIGAASGGFAPKGTYTSAVLDATQISRFGKMHLLGTLPAGATLKLATRSGNVQEAAADGWSPWSDDVSAAEYVPIAAPAARFFQYRLTFTSDDGKSTATDHERRCRVSASEPRAAGEVGDADRRRTRPARPMPRSPSPTRTRSRGRPRTRTTTRLHTASTSAPARAGRGS